MEKLILIATISLVINNISFGQDEGFSFRANAGIAIALGFDGKSSDYTHLEANAPYTYQKIGSYGNVAGSFFFNSRHSITLGFSYNEHQQKVKRGLYVSFDSTTAVDVTEDFNLKYSLKIFEGLYGYRLLTNSDNNFTIQGGLYYMRMRDQQVIFYGSSNYFLMLERNTKTHGLEELGLSAGFLYERKIYDQVSLNFSSSYFYEVSTGIHSHISLTTGVSIYF